jgi:hypothetical protein
MRHAIRLAVTAIWVVLGTACAGHTPYNPFLVPQARIYGAVKTIALAPVVAPRELNRVDPARGRFDTLLTAQLRAAGFAVVPADSSLALWKHFTDSLGGLFDPTTGARDSAKFSLARRLTMAALKQRFGADAWLHPRIVFSPAKFDAGKATWDGATENYQSFGAKFLSALLGTETYGRTPALSFAVDLEDLDGRDLYVDQGGLQLYELPHGRQFEPIPDSALYADPDRNAKAVQLALRALVTRTAP